MSPRKRTWNITVRLPLVLLCLACFAGGQEPVEKEKGETNPLEGRPEAVAAGQKLFATACSGCHGLHGEGGRGPNLADGHLTRDVSDKKLFNSIRKGVRGTPMPPFDLPEEKIWQLLAYVRSLSAPAFGSPVPGDPQAGQVIFFGKGGCSDCHTILGRGHFLGPDLSNVGMTRSWKQLRDALLDPKSRSTTGYQGVTVITQAGATITGILRNNSNYALEIQDTQGNLHLLLMEEVREVRYKANSLMPDNYAGRLTQEEIDNVLAYLSRRSLRPAKARSSSPEGHSRSAQ